MLTLTKIRREILIDHVMPSDLDKDDIKHGLQLKEEMLSKITDDYIKQTIPDWREIERDYRKRGISDIMDKIMCGEMSLDDIPKPQPIKCETWLRWKKFNPDSFNSVTKKYDFDTEEGFSDWIKQDENMEIELKTREQDIMVQMQIVLDGECCDRYFPYQSYNFNNGWEFVDDNVKLYDCANWDRNEDGTLKYGPYEDVDMKNDEFYRLFFRNKKGYPVYNWFYEDETWNEANYPGRKVSTILCDIFRMKYCGEKTFQDYEEFELGQYPVAMLTGHQWVKRSYKCEMLNNAIFTIKYDVN